ncbi:MAG TPA: radical SAM protein [Candidatus Sumerlaeia bacterium]|nr:radical SAM protein [Candidatus Sumerlaeia bacterium]
MLGWQFLTEENRRTILRGIREGAPFGGPYHLEFDWCDPCNLHCFFCNNKNRNQNGKFLSYETIRSILDETSPDLHSVRLSGGGEPLFHKHIHKILDLLCERKIIIDNFTTNGVLLSPEITDSLTRMRVNEVIVSLNYPDAASYSEEMGTLPQNFDRVVKNVEYLSQKRRGKNSDSSIKITLQFLICGRTAFDIPRMVELGNRLGVDYIYLRGISGIEPSKRIAEKDKERVKEDLRQALIDDARQRRLIVNLVDEGLDPFYCEAMHEVYAIREEPYPSPIRANNEYCYMPYYSAAIRGDGGVYPCCMLINDGGSEPLGNVNEQGIKEIWRGKAFAIFRKEMETVQIMRPPLDVKKCGFRAIFDVCATHYGCPITWNLCDADFYQKAEAIHRSKRNSLRGLFLRARKKLHRFF